MITFPSILAANGLPFVMQTLTHPAVYLDTWALRQFAEGDRALGSPRTSTPHVLPVATSASSQRSRECRS
jgi:hypothetical protein